METMTLILERESERSNTARFRERVGPDEPKTLTQPVYLPKRLMEGVDVLRVTIEEVK